MQSERKIQKSQQALADHMVDDFELDVMRTVSRVPRTPTIVNQVLLPRGATGVNMILFAAMSPATSAKLHPESFAPGYIEEKKKRKRAAAAKNKKTPTKTKKLSAAKQKPQPKKRTKTKPPPRQRKN